MQEQYIDFMAGQTARPPVSAEEIAGMTTVAVAPGPGLARVFESLGVGAIISGGQTMNPSTEDILKAINAVKTDKVIVLPNNKNIILAAEQAKQLTQKTVAIVATTTVPQGISALLAFNFQNDLNTNVQAMSAAAKHIKTVEITTATRSARFDGVEVKEGQVIALIDDVLSAAGEDRAVVTLQVLKHIGAEDAEIVTVYYGDSISAREAETLGERIRKAFPNQEIEIVSGAQPHYHYIISVE